MKRAPLYLQVATLILMLGSGMNWTGLAYKISQQLDMPSCYAYMQAFSTLAQIVTPLFCLRLCRKIRASTSLAWLCFVSSVFCTLLFVCWYGISNPYLLAAGMIPLIFSNMIVMGTLAILLEPAYAYSVENGNPNESESKSLRQKFALFGTYSIFGKLIGMSLGPLFFEAISMYTLLLNGVTSMLAGFILLRGFQAIPLDVLKVKEGENFFRLLKEREKLKPFISPPFFETAIVNSSIFLVVMLLSTRLSNLNASPYMLSLYWFGATACSLISHATLSRSPALNRFLGKIERRCGYVIIIPIVIGAVTQSQIGILICQFLFSLLNPIVSNTSRARFFQTFGRQGDTTIAYVFRNFISNLITLSFACLVMTSQYQIGYLLAIGTAALLFTYRWILGGVVHQENQEYVTDPS